METRANYLIIGVFVLGVLGMLLGFIYWMGNDASGPQGKNYYVLFEGSVQGLTEASPVLFNGIRFGAVRSIELVPEIQGKCARSYPSAATLRSAPIPEPELRSRASQAGLPWKSHPAPPMRPCLRPRQTRSTR